MLGRPVERYEVLAIDLGTRVARTVYVCRQAEESIDGLDVHTQNPWLLLRLTRYEQTRLGFEHTTRCVKLDLRTGTVLQTIDIPGITMTESLFCESRGGILVAGYRTTSGAQTPDYPSSFWYVDEAGKRRELSSWAEHFSRPRPIPGTDEWLLRKEVPKPMRGPGYLVQIWTADLDGNMALEAQLEGPGGLFGVTASRRAAALCSEGVILWSLGAWEKRRTICPLPIDEWEDADVWDRDW